MFFKLILFSLFLTERTTFGSACCGGGFASPALIVGDERAQLTSSYTYSEVLDEVGTDALWRRRGSREIGESLRIEGAHILGDRAQAGFTLPLIRRAREGERSSGLGDVSASLGYEYLPDWDFSAWRPRGLGFLQLTLPTGTSVQEADTTYQLDSRGRGFWALGLGTILTKAFGRWDVFANFEIHKSFAKHFANAQTEGTLNPGLGGTSGGGVGYNFANARIGSSLVWSYEDPVGVEGAIASRGAAQRFATATVSASYMFDEAWAVTLAIADQTLFGSAYNTTLGRGVTVFLQRRWLR